MQRKRSERLVFGIEESGTFAISPETPGEASGPPRPGEKRGVRPVERERGFEVCGCRPGVWAERGLFQPSGLSTCRGSRVGVLSLRVGEGVGIQGWPVRPMEIGVSKPTDILESISACG